ncbi:MAG: FAD-dependent oxidoreductase [Chloroflexi bacterium]|nr:FAD-dependent oxidoreductase [Chloroflexota bacterium]MCL5075235.1 FAD-dependent oxidoreductase [Chloroflexota bacterium]
MEEEKFDVIVVGAGPSGIAAAYALAKAGLQVVVFERGDYPGSKNVMGGVLYRQPTEALIPQFWKEAPLERQVVEQQRWIMTEDSAVIFSYRSQRFAQEPYNAFTVLRAKFDSWLANKATEAGALLITETVVEDVIWQNGKVVGVRTGRAEGDLYADVVVAADGVNSLLAKKAGLHTELSPQQVSLTVKEIIALPKEKIEDRFSLEGDEGATIELYGQATKGMTGNGFIYANKESLSLGVGVMLSDFVKREISPYDLIEEMKSHPLVQRLIAGGEPKEYMAHLIPEGGYKAIPKLYTDGLLVVGDAAQLVNSLFREGSNLAMTSGRLAAEAILRAKERGDFSAQSLSFYQRLLQESFVLKDLKQYESATEFMESNPHFLSLYPQLLNEAAHELTLVDSVPKKQKQKAIIRNVRRHRSLWQLAKDAYNAWRAFA